MGGVRVFDIRPRRIFEHCVVGFMCNKYDTWVLDMGEYLIVI